MSEQTNEWKDNRGAIARAQRRASESRAVITDIVFPSDTNHLGTMFGGKVMEYMDKVAAISAMRHARCAVVTASTDHIDFVQPIRLGDVITVESFVTWTHRSSMEVYVSAQSENLRTGDRITAVTAFFIFVALNDEGKPTAVPGIVPESAEELQLHDSAAERYAERNKRMEERKRST
ncbi:acyl-CoA thioesterase [Paenibacillus curdlanolyticus]|nr:acyl-CoA thioesterase [Paenibacillus curdlanolyticus]